jgi:hypothetical protein
MLSPTAVEVTDRLKHYVAVSKDSARLAKRPTIDLYSEPVKSTPYHHKLFS